MGWDDDNADGRLNILFIGDVFGRPGREAVSRRLPSLKRELDVHFCIINGENSAGGKGITLDVARQLYESGADVITLGNHAWDNRSVFSFIDSDERIVRPANFPPGTPGRGWVRVTASDGTPVVVAQCLCRLFMNPIDSPFAAADEILNRFNRDDIVIFDLHGESTSEKVAFGWHVDGRATAVFGTHTHIQTADERVLPEGCAYITDAGMSGSYDSIIGMDIDAALGSFLTGIRQPFRIARDNVKIMGVLVGVDKSSGRAVTIRRISARDDDGGWGE